MAISAAPAVPNPVTDSASTFGTRAYAFFTWLAGQFAADVNSTEANVITLAAQAAVNANNAATAALAAGAAAWNAGTAYTAGQGAISGVNQQLYRSIAGGTNATDPANDPTHWQRATAPQYPSASTQALPVTLTQTSVPFMRLTSAGPQNALTLPSAAACTAGEYGHFYNSSRWDVPVRNTSGTLVGFIPPKTDVIIELYDNSTANGAWIISGGSFFGLTYAGTISGLTNGSYQTTAGTALKQVNVDATRDFLLWQDNSGGLYCVTVDSVAGPGSPATLVVSGTTATAFTALAISTTQVLVVYFNGTGTLTAQVVGLSGTTQAVNMAATSTISPVYSANFEDLIAVGSTYVCGWYDGTNSCNQAITVSGTTPSFGTKSVVASDGSLELFVVGGTSLLMLCSTTSTIKATAYTFSGGTATAGATATGTISANGWCARQLTSGRVAVLTSSACALVNVSGTTSTVSITSTIGVGAGAVFAHAIGNQVIVFNAAAGSSLICNVVTDNSGTPVIGTAITLHPLVFASAITYLGGNAANTEAWFAVLATSAYRPFAIAIGISGNNPVVNNVSAELPGVDLLNLSPSPIAHSATGTSGIDRKGQYQNALAGTWGCSIPGAAAAQDNWLYFDGATAMVDKRPRAPLGITTSLLPWTNLVSVQVNPGSRSARWALQLEGGSPSTTVRIMKLEAA